MKTYKLIVVLSAVLTATAIATFYVSNGTRTWVDDGSYETVFGPPPVTDGYPTATPRPGSYTTPAPRQTPGAYYTPAPYQTPMPYRSPAPYTTPKPTTPPPYKLTLPLPSRK